MSIVSRAEWPSARIASSAGISSPEASVRAVSRLSGPFVTKSVTFAR